MAQHGHLTRKEKKDIRRKRKILRKDLKRRGIRSKAEFEAIAQQMGLVYGERKGPLGFWWWFLDTFGMGAIIAAVIAMLTTMTVVFSYAYLNRKMEDFTIALSGNLLRDGFDLSETEDFSNPQTYLNTTVLQSCNAISVSQLPEGLDDAEGTHNGDNYLAYTFWIRNNGEKEIGYDWQVTLNSETLNTTDAVWLMLFDEGKQVIYAKAPTGQKQEKLAGYSEWPLYDEAADPDTQYYTGSKGKGIATTAFIDDTIVAEGSVEKFPAGEKHKYTVVLWIEGDDPECKNDKLDGSAMFNFKFAAINDEEGTFDDFIYSEDEYYKDQTEASGDATE